MYITIAFKTPLRGSTRNKLLAHVQVVIFSQLELDLDMKAGDIKTHARFAALNWKLAVGRLMLSLTFAVILSIANMLDAALIDMSLDGWLVAHEASGIQLFVY